ncbi:asparaginase domain-containing protein [uncultured Aquimarina sp.]|uniref:asparaginase domain-containing protein n=1 Tax=uncultured Aquimarina sp. TaxID=575652 RepID=UPI00262460B0|nr:asparaginase domain-containing protein [uncultured Aquimarina sp.]
MIHILTTGGTIGGTDQKDGEVMRTSVSIDDFLQIPNVSFNYRIDTIFDKDSRLINQEDRELLAQKIRSSMFDKILITHGTFSMEDTAQFLGVLKIKKTIILVGSLILGSGKNTDASFNLGYSIAALQFLNNGVYIAMNGKVFDWFNVYKNLGENKFMTLRP